MENGSFDSERGEALDISGSLSQERIRVEHQRIGDVSTPHRAVLEAPRVDKLNKAFEAYPSSLDLAQIGKLGKAFEASRSALGLAEIGKLGKAFEVSRFVLGLAEIGKLGKQFNSLVSEVSPTLKNVSIEALLDELKGRIKFPEEPSTDVEHEEVETNAKAPSTLTGEARVVISAQQDLSSVPTWLLWCLIHIMIAPLYLVYNWESARQGIVDLNARIPQTESFFEIRNFIRTQLAGKPGDIRLVTGANVNMRENPSMKSAVILQLPKNAPVVVLGKEDRTWLLVSYEHQEYVIDGFVSTKMLKKIRKK